MKTRLYIAIASTLMMACSVSCSHDPYVNRGAARGVVVGGITGAVIGNNIRGGNSWGGAAIGAVGGTMVGGRQARQNQAQQKQYHQSQRQELMDTWNRAAGTCMEAHGYSVG